LFAEGNIGSAVAEVL
jgi:hypothetical protein